LVLNQLSNKGRCRRNILAIFFIGSIFERTGLVHHWSKNSLPSKPNCRLGIIETLLLKGSF
jgi:hypothetical protein